MSKRRVKVRMIDKGWKSYVKEFLTNRKPHVQVGVISAGKHPGSNASVAEIAAIHEFGAPRARIPARSFIRAPLEPGKGVQTQMTMLAKKIMSPKHAMPVEKALEILGQWAVARINAYVREGNNLKPLKPSTIERKGSSRPLIDTGRLLQSVTYRVKAR